MKLTDKEYMSRWAFNQCFKGNDTKEIRDIITSPKWIYCYYMYVNKLQEMKNKVDLNLWDEFSESIRGIFPESRDDFILTMEVDKSQRVITSKDSIFSLII